VTSQPWTLNKLLVLLLAGTFLGLSVDLRYEHVDKVRETWIAWIPIVYSGAMAGVCLVCLLLWDHRGREVLFGAFALSAVVGLLGFWMHSQGDPLARLAVVLDAWTQFEHHANTPPTLAPLAFCGLAPFGMLACAVRFQPVLPSPIGFGPGK
jgi:hypothetical protein